jgi:tRNA(Ile2) C34 agmatinyltransferase TiaS
MTTQRIHADMYRLLLSDAEPWRDDGTRIVELNYRSVDGADYLSKIKVYHVGRQLKLVCPQCGKRVKSVVPSARGLRCDKCQGRAGA